MFKLIDRVAWNKVLMPYRRPSSPHRKASVKAKSTGAMRCRRYRILGEFGVGCSAWRSGAPGEM